MAKKKIRAVLENLKKDEIAKVLVKVVSQSIEDFLYKEREGAEENRERVQNDERERNPESHTWDRKDWRSNSTDYCFWLGYESAIENISNEFDAFLRKAGLRDD